MAENPSTEPNPLLQGIVHNAFGEQSLFGVNRNLFRDSDASSVFRARFGDTLFNENTLYVIAGTDSGLLYQFVKSHGVPKGSHYLFVELPQVLALLNDIDDPDSGLSVTDIDHWEQRGNELGIADYAINEQLELHRSLAVVHGHLDDYSPFWRQIHEAYNTFLDKQRIALNRQPFTLRQIENLTENQIPAIRLRGAFTGKTAVVLAGGPSLDEVLPWVRENRDNLLVISVCRISKTLYLADIQPDIVVSVDPYPIMLYVSQDMLKFQQGTLLLNEFHLSSNLLSSWGGKKAYMGKHFPWSTPLEPENLPPTVGNTVTNTAFNTAVTTGVSQIILGGVDFCFSREGYTHASGSAEHALGFRPMYGNARVTTNSGEMAETRSSYSRSAKTFDAQAGRALEQGCRTINPAASAMRLANIEHIPLDNITIEPLQKPAQAIIDDIIPDCGADQLIPFYEENLSEVDQQLQALRNVRSLSEKALKYNHALFRKGKNHGGAHNNAKLDKIEKQFKTTYADTITFMNYFGIRRLIPIINHTERHKDDIEEAGRLHFQAMIDTANDLIEALQRARRRIHTRIEEEKPDPDINTLISQWKEDKQVGRAIQWVNKHADTAAGLSTEETAALQAFIETYDDYLEKLGRLYQMQIEKDISLDGLDARAREYFQCQDAEGLQRLLTGLQKHSLPQQAQLLSPLVEGYLSELRGNTKDAIDAYQHAINGPARIDALVRLFELHTKADNLDASLTVLKDLSDINETYTPMYADLLQATGNVEESVNIYTDYLLKNPDDLTSMMKLGKLFYQHGASDGVEWAMSFILSKDPHNETAKSMLRSLQASPENKE